MIGFERDHGQAALDAQLDVRQLTRGRAAMVLPHTRIECDGMARRWWCGMQLVHKWRHHGHGQRSGGRHQQKGGREM